MTKHTQTIRWQIGKLSVFDYFVKLTLKGLKAREVYVIGKIFDNILDNKQINISKIYDGL